MAHPHYSQWWIEQLAEVKAAAAKFPPVELTTESSDPPPAAPLPEAKIQPLSQEALEMSESISEDTVETTGKIPQSKSDMTQCEFCGAVIKNKKQARAVHLRWCKPYIASQRGQKKSDKPRETNGHAGPVVAFDDTVALSAAQVSKLWQAVTGGSLSVEVLDGEIVGRVSKSSFDKALPVLLDLL